MVLPAWLPGVLYLDTLDTSSDIIHQRLMEAHVCCTELLLSVALGSEVKMWKLLIRNPAKLQIFSPEVDYKASNALTRGGLAQGKRTL